MDFVIGGAQKLCARQRKSRGSEFDGYALRFIIPRRASKTFISLSI